MCDSTDTHTLMTYFEHSRDDHIDHTLTGVQEVVAENFSIWQQEYECHYIHESSLLYLIRKNNISDIIFSYIKSF